jgi:hypothetical protein
MTMTPLSILQYEPDWSDVTPESPPTSLALSTYWGYDLKSITTNRGIGHKRTDE